MTFNGTYDASFKQAPSLAAVAVAGTYSGIGPSAGTTVTVATSGAITGTDGGCTFTGTATPRTDGNAFNVPITDCLATAVVEIAVAAPLMLRERRSHATAIDEARPEG